MDKELGVHTDWGQGKLPGAVYRMSLLRRRSSCVTHWAGRRGARGDDLSKVIAATFERYAVSNLVHPDVFPLIPKMEAEIVAMCLRMYDNPGVAGTMTSGGTKSIVMGIKTYSVWARDVKDMTEPECERFSFSL